MNLPPIYKSNGSLLPDDHPSMVSLKATVGDERYAKYRKVFATLATLGGDHLSDMHRDEVGDLFVDSVGDLLQETP